MKSNKLNFAVAALVLGSVIAFTQSSFTTVKHAITGKTTVQYHFKGTTLAADKMAANYEVYSSQTCASGTTLPCIIEVDGDLQTWLNSQTKEAIRDNALVQKQ
jgi:hypothetical protein